MVCDGEGHLKSSRKCLKLVQANFVRPVGESVRELAYFLSEIRCESLIFNRLWLGADPTADRRIFSP
jgi:hypothetical protein